MWTDAIVMFLFIFMLFAYMLAFPICLGALLRLLMRKKSPSHVAWLGAGLGCFAHKSFAYQSAMMNNIMDVFPLADNSFLAAMILNAIGILIFLAIWFVLVKMGVELVDKAIKQQSGYCHLRK